jgi:hypothetical protein
VWVLDAFADPVELRRGQPGQFPHRVSPSLRFTSS